MASGGLHSGASAPPPNVLLLWVALHNAIEAIDRAVENLQSYSRYLTNDQFEQTLEILEQNPATQEIADRARGIRDATLNRNLAPHLRDIINCHCPGLLSPLVQQPHLHHANREGNATAIPHPRYHQPKDLPADSTQTNSKPPSGSNAATESSSPNTTLTMSRAPASYLNAQVPSSGKGKSKVLDVPTSLPSPPGPRPHGFNGWGEKKHPTNKFFDHGDSKYTSKGNEIKPLPQIEDILELLSTKNLREKIDHANEKNLDGILKQLQAPITLNGYRPNCGLKRDFIKTLLDFFEPHYTKENIGYLACFPNYRKRLFDGREKIKEDFIARLVAEKAMKGKPEKAPRHKFSKWDAQTSEAQKNVHVAEDSNAIHGESSNGAALTATAAIQNPSGNGSQKRKDIAGEHSRSKRACTTDAEKGNQDVMYKAGSTPTHQPRKPPRLGDRLTPDKLSDAEVDDD